MKWILPLLLLLTINSAQADWYNGDWLNRQKFTIDAGKVNGDLTDFPVYVDLSDFDVTNFGTNGADLRVTKSDGTTEVPREVVFFDGANGELHFKAAGTLSGSSNSDFYLYYNNSGASDYATSATYGAENVWNSNYIAVWHMQQDPSGSAPQMLDSTANSYDGTTQGSMTGGDLVAGQIGSALDLDGTGDCFTVPYAAPFDLPDSYTYSGWTNSTQTASTSIMGNLTAGAQSDGWTTNMQGGSNQYLQLTYNGGIQVINFSTSDPTDGNWHIFHSTQDGATSASLYFDGFVEVTDSSVVRIGPKGTQLTVGARNAGATNAMDGILDEVRMLDTDLTAEWIWTEYNNQSSPSTFYSVSAEENAPVESGGTGLEFGFWI